MERSGDQLLAGSALADDQYGGVHRGRQPDRFEDLEHRGTAADQLGLVVVSVLSFSGVLLRPRSQGLDFDGQGPLPQGPFQGQKNFVEVERLAQVVVCSASHRFDRRRRAAQCGDDDDRQVGQQRLQLGKHLQPIAAGHLQVQEHSVGILGLNAGQGLVAVGRLDGPVALGLEQPDEVAADRRVIVGHEDRRVRLTHRCSP